LDGIGGKLNEVAEVFGSDGRMVDIIRYASFILSLAQI
jgi:hypothetical protein